MIHLILFLPDKRRASEGESYSAVTIKKQKFVENPLENGTASEEEDDLDDLDDEKPLEVLPLAVPSEKVLGKCGVWGETFFFKPDDSRLKGSFKFFRAHCRNE
jgi:hypothetical protein